MSARFDSHRFNLTLLAIAGYLTAFASLGRGMHRIIRLSMFIHLVWISLLCGVSWASASPLTHGHQLAPAPYTALQRDVAQPPAGQRLLLKESDACEKLLASLENAPDEEADSEPQQDAISVTPSVLLLALLHSGLSPPLTRQTRPYPSSDRPLKSVRLLSSADARAPPQG